MHEYIRRILGFAETCGEIKTGKIIEATTYCPKTIRLEGITETGEKFTVEFTIGECLTNA